VMQTLHVVVILDHKMMHALYSDSKPELKLFIMMFEL